MHTYFSFVLSVWDIQKSENTWFNCTFIFGSITRKKPFLRKSLKSRCLNFIKCHQRYNIVIRSKPSFVVMHSISMFGNKKGLCTRKSSWYLTVKYRDGYFMCFVDSGSDVLVKIDGIMNSAKLQDGSAQNLVASARFWLGHRVLNKTLQINTEMEKVRKPMFGGFFKKVFSIKTLTLPEHI